MMFLKSTKQKRSSSPYEEKRTDLVEVELGLIRRPGKIRSVADARGIVSCVAIRELGYKGTDVGRKLNLGPAGVSVGGNLS